MADTYHDDDNVPAAATIRFGVCGCPDVHIHLLDADDRPIAKVVMSPEEWALASDGVTKHIAEVRARQGDTIGDVAGRA